MDGNLRGEYVKYQGQEIVYQHQLWRVQNQSVCSNYQKYSPEHTKCTVVASQYFSETCRTLSQKNSSQNYMPQIRKMMCAASVSFKPTIAEVSAPKQKTASEKLEQECNQLILQASLSEDDAIANKRDRVCAKYKSIEQ